MPYLNSLEEKYYFIRCFAGMDYQDLKDNWSTKDGSLQKTNESNQRVDLTR